MPDSSLTEIADKLAAAITAAQLTCDGEAATATRDWSPHWSLADLRTLRVTVVPIRRKLTQLSRISWEWRYFVSVGIQKRHGGPPGDDAPADRLDPLDGLTETVMGLIGETLLECTGFKARLVDLDNPVALSDEMLERKRTFTSVIEAQYRKGP